MSCTSCLSQLLLKLLHGTVVKTLPFEATSQLLPFAWNCRAKVASRGFACNCCARAALQNSFLSLCVELSCKSCVAELFLNLLHGAVLQKLPFETIAQGFAWHHRARVVSRSYFLSFFMEPSRGRGRANLFLIFLIGGLSCKRTVRQMSWA